MFLSPLFKPYIYIHILVFMYICMYNACFLAWPPVYACLGWLDIYNTSIQALWSGLSPRPGKYMVGVFWGGRKGVVGSIVSVTSRLFVCVAIDATHCHPPPPQKKRIWIIAAFSVFYYRICYHWAILTNTLPFLFFLFVGGREDIHM